MEKKIHYYDRTAEKKAATPVVSKARGATAWLRGETADMFAAKLQASGETVTKQRMYMAYEHVAMESRLKWKKDLKGAYAALYRSQPPEVQKLLRPGNFDKVQTMKDMPHYSYGPLAEMLVTNDDGSKTFCQLAASSFPAKVIPGENGLHFRDVPTPKDGVAVPSQYFCIARKIDPITGKLGDLDPNFTKDGIAFTPKDARELVEKVYEVGRNSIRAERAHIIRAAKEAHLSGGWPMRETFDPRKSPQAQGVDMRQGIAQGNVVQPTFPGPRPRPEAKQDQQYTLKRAM